MKKEEVIIVPWTFLEEDIWNFDPTDRVLALIILDFGGIQFVGFSSFNDALHSAYGWLITE